MAGPGQGLQQLFTQALGQMAPSAGAFNPMGVLQSAEQAGQRDQTLALQSNKFAWDKGQDIIGNQQNAEKMAIDREKAARDALLDAIKLKKGNKELSDDEKLDNYIAATPKDQLDAGVITSLGGDPEKYFTQTPEEKLADEKEKISHRKKEERLNRAPTTATKTVIDNKTGKPIGSHKADSPKLDPYMNNPRYTVVTATAQGTPGQFGDSDVEDAQTAYLGAGFTADTVRQLRDAVAKNPNAVAITGAVARNIWAPIAAVAKFVGLDKASKRIEEEFGVQEAVNIQTLASAVVTNFIAPVTREESRYSDRDIQRVELIANALKSPFITSEIIVGQLDELERVVLAPERLRTGIIAKQLEASDIRNAYEAGVIYRETAEFLLGTYFDLSSGDYKDIPKDDPLMLQGDQLLEHNRRMDEIEKMNQSKQ